MRWYNTVVLIYLFWRLVMLLATCMSSLEKCLFRSLPIFNWNYFLFWDWIVSFLCIILSNVSFANIFPLFSTLPFIVLLVPFILLSLKVKFLVSGNPIWLFFAFVSLMKGDRSLSPYLQVAKAEFKEHTDCFLLAGLRFLVIFNLKSIFNLFYICCKKMVQFDSYTCSCPVLPTLFIEEVFFSLLYFLASYTID